jgi:xylose isomerase
VIKNSPGIWAFGPAVSRFVPPSYHSEVSGEDMGSKTRRVCEGLSDLLDSLEYHPPDRSTRITSRRYWTFLGT